LIANPGEYAGAKRCFQEILINAGGARIKELMGEVNQPSAGIFLHLGMELLLWRYDADTFSQALHLTSACLRLHQA
jgi:hypothetical protein